MGDKRFKDPVYGYIHVSEKYINIIDTAVFQRLRRVIQTSYAPLYSSAVHNRFVHSMGVYHLGEIAINTVVENVDSNIPRKLGINLEHCSEIFKLAIGREKELNKLNKKDNHLNFRKKGTTNKPPMK